MHYATDISQLELSPIIGQYCSLVPLEMEKHAEALFQSFGHDEAVFVNNLYGAFPDQKSFNEWLVVAEIPQKQFVVFFNNEANGIVNVHNLDPIHAVAEIGVTYAKIMQNTIASTEAIYLILVELFEKYYYKRVQWHCICSNVKSINAAKRLGFIEEAICRNYYVHKGRSYDGLYFSILDYEWVSLRDNFIVWLHTSNFDESGLQIYKLNDNASKITYYPSLSNQIVENWQNSIIPADIKIAGNLINLVKLDLEIHADILFEFTRLYPEMFTYTNFGPFRDVEELVNWFGAFHKIWHHFCLFDNESGRLLAIVSLIEISLDSGIVELSYLMLPEYLYEGAMLQEMLHLLLQELFLNSGYRRCQMQCNTENHSLWSHFEKFAVFEGVLRNNVITRGQSCDNALFSITIEDFNRSDD